MTKLSPFVTRRVLGARRMLVSLNDLRHLGGG